MGLAVCLWALWRSVVQRQALEADLKKRLQVHEENMKRADRLSAMGEMAAVMAHELNQPLAAISTYASGLLHLLKVGDYQKQDMETALIEVQKQTIRASQIITSVQDFVVRREPQRMVLQFRDVFQAVLPLIELQAKTYRTELDINLTEPLPPVFVEKVALEQVILNLTRNAFQAMQDPAVKNRELHICAAINGALVQVDFIDHGTGISNEIGSRLFSPFFSTKADGMGMGLNICRTIIESHGGQLTYRPNPAGGTIFSFTLPLMDSKSAGSQSA